MKKRISNFVVVFLMGCLLFNFGFAQENQKLAQTGFQFLSVVSDARAASMAGAMTSLQIGSSALFFNPAGMAKMDKTVDLTASINQWIADINHYTFSLAFNPAGGDYGVFGFSFQYVNYGDFIGTRVNTAEDKGYTDVGIFHPNAAALGFGYARQLSDRFCVGGHISWAQQNLTPDINHVVTQRTVADSTVSDTTSQTVQNKLKPLIFDFGTQFKTGIKSLVFGMSIRNFSAEYKYVQEEFQAPLEFNLGISMNLFDLLSHNPDNQTLYMCVDATHFRDHPEEIKIGLEYNFMNVLMLRGGYISKSQYDESAFSFGVGLAYTGFAFDYSYTPFGVFDKVQRVTARFSL